MKRVATIGVYGWTRERFLDALRDADVGLLIDVRQRRGVRGREYSWANAQRLQRARRSRHRVLAPQGARADDRAAARPVRGRRPARRRQALTRGARARVPR